MHRVLSGLLGVSLGAALALTAAPAAAAATGHQTVAAASVKANCPGHLFRSKRSLVPLYRAPRLDAPNAGYYGGDTCFWVSGQTGPNGPKFNLFDGSTQNGRWVLDSDVYQIG